MKLPTEKLDAKIIALDLDDTLLNHDLKITPKTVTALRTAAERGIYITLCSGRTENAILPYVHQLDIAGLQTGRFLIASNGATVYDMHKRLVIYQHEVSPAILQSANDEAVSMGLICQVYDPSTIYVSADNKWTRIDIGLSRLKMQVVGDFPALLEKGFPKMVIPGEPEILQLLKKKLEKKLGGEAVIFISKPYFLEVMPPRTGKGEAILWLAERLGIPQEKTMGFGDSMNDESMMHLTHYSVAMLNGLPFIQNIATYVTEKTNEDDGIGDFITKYVL